MVLRTPDFNRLDLALELGDQARDLVILAPLLGDDFGLFCPDFRLILSRVIQVVLVFRFETAHPRLEVGLLHRSNSLHLLNVACFDVERGV
ncbi:hypothetical protein [Rhizobium laguerreae]|uniref:hypothetical protein n=1 Tax=Rhizobium laguerreae TaxID=1076926 RepID=UPI001C917482|nr:hypothetical protein [Rhizobium laguerreae]